MDIGLLEDVDYIERRVCDVFFLVAACIFNQSRLSCGFHGGGCTRVMTG